MSWAAFSTSSSAPDTTLGQRSSRRQRLAALAASAYRASASAVRETYATSRDAFTYDAADIQHMPGAFPDSGIVSQGREHLLVFPTYAKQHAKPPPCRRYTAEGDEMPVANGIRDDEYWLVEWERTADERAVVDVDVRGWLYTPQKPPLTKRMRLMVALAKSMSGIPTLKQDQEAVNEAGLTTDELEQIRSQVQRPSAGGSDLSFAARRSTTGSTAGSTSGSTSTVLGPDMTSKEIAAANQTLMTRISPFLTTPLYQMPVTVFFYNNELSQARTFYTDESGHFMARVALNFVPTSIRILVDEHMSNSGLSKRVDINFLPPRGISVISDIDDTIKFSNVTGGPKEILRNTFVRDMENMMIEGISDWYNAMAAKGVDFHYVSNSPWQVYPLLTTFFKLANIPRGSMHLKQYNGMLQGMWESAADRKRPSLERLVRDFPARKFLLIGDSGEADLELYTELAMLYPENVLGIFIRDITTPENNQEARRLGLSQKPSDMSLRRPSLPPRMPSSLPSNSSTSLLTPPPPPPPPRSPRKEELLIDFSDDTPSTPPPPISRIDTDNSTKPKPPRPNKPAGLKGAPPPITRKPFALQGQNTSAIQSPPILTQKQSLLKLSTSNDPPACRTLPPAPPPRRRTASSQTPPVGTPESGQSTTSSFLSAHQSSRPHLTPALAPFAAMTNAANSTASETPTPVAVLRKIEMWRARLREAQYKLERMGIPLYTWRRGEDVVEEALGLVRDEVERGN